MTSSRVVKNVLKAMVAADIIEEGSDVAAAITSFCLVGLGSSAFLTAAIVINYIPGISPSELGAWVALPCILGAYLGSQFGSQLPYEQPERQQLVTKILGQIKDARYPDWLFTKERGLLTWRQTEGWSEYTGSITADMFYASLEPVRRNWAVENTNRLIEIINDFGPSRFWHRWGPALPPSIWVVVMRYLFFSLLILMLGLSLIQLFQ